MTPTTTRHPTPAATRTGRGAAAPPQDPRPDEIPPDPTLSSTAKAIVTVLVRNWAWVKDHCWPCDKTLAAKVGKSVGHVQRCLLELEQAGRIRREKTDEVPNGRRIWLLWRSPGGREGAQREIAPARTVPAAPARSKQVVIVNEGREPEIRPESRPRTEAAPTATAFPNLMASPMAPSPADGPNIPPVQCPEPQEPRETASATEMGECPASSFQSISGAAGGRSDDPVLSPAPSDPIGPLVVLDLGAIGRPAMSSLPMAPRIPRTSTP